MDHFSQPLYVPEYTEDCANVITYTVYGNTAILLAGQDPGHRDVGSWLKTADYSLHDVWRETSVFHSIS